MSVAFRSFFATLLGLLITTVGAFGAEVDGWHITDQLNPPDNGSVYSSTYYASSGWQYATENSEAFFGDSGRELRLANSTEELVWEAAGMKGFALIVYSLDRNVASTVDVAASYDESTWESIPYDVEVMGRSEAGWYKLRLSGLQQLGYCTRLLKVTFKKGDIGADAIQLGQFDVWGPK